MTLDLDEFSSSIGISTTCNTNSLVSELSVEKGRRTGLSRGNFKKSPFEKTSSPSNDSFTVGSRKMRKYDLFPDSVIEEE